MVLLRRLRDWLSVETEMVSGDEADMLGMLGRLGGCGGGVGLAGLRDWWMVNGYLFSGSVLLREFCELLRELTLLENEGCECGVGCPSVRHK